jgi:hypothetical protein
MLTFELNYLKNIPLIFQIDYLLNEKFFIS